MLSPKGRLTFFETIVKNNGNQTAKCKNAQKINPFFAGVCIEYALN